KHTNNLIKELISNNDINSTTCMLLLNTLYFKGQWKDSFKKYLTTKEKFKMLSNNIKDVDMMTIQKTFPYYEDENYQLLELPYKSDFSFGILLPKKTFIFPVEVADYFNKLNYAKVECYIPKFTQRNKMSLKDTFQKLGVKSLFNDADFSRMTSDQNISVSDIIHEVVVIIDEEGTEASAATAIVMMRNCMSIDKSVPILFKA